MPDVNNMRRGLLLASAAAAGSFIVGPQRRLPPNPKG